ncbi:hypothetical protein ACIOWI_31945 [Streptomyces sp. NPDC087659]|uniref:hypothetical protein n=1 Tax=Streptomyces sp. NPDC087659 TaxID=3365801 RepID=UPI0037FE0A20
MYNEPNNTNPHDPYTTKITEVLETNTQEQERVRSQITDLQARLARLQHDHKLLSEMCGTMAGAQVEPAPEGGAASSDTVHGEAAPSQAVPQPRRAKAKRAAGAPRRQQKQKQKQKQTASSKPRLQAKAAAKKTGPSLQQLVQGLLTDEPQTVRELVKALAEAHPERAVSNAQLVRNALNALIAKSLAERTQQGSTVFYTTPENETASVPVPGPATVGAPAVEKAAAEA